MTLEGIYLSSQNTLQTCIIKACVTLDSRTPCEGCKGLYDLGEPMDSTQ